MIFETFIEAVATMLGTSLESGAIIFASIVILFLIIAVNVGKRRAEPIITISIGLMGSIMFTVAGWYPVLVGAAIALVFSLLMAWYVSKIGGK